MSYAFKITLFVSVISLVACSPTFDKEYYQKVTGIFIPEKSRIVETYDNGEFLTVTSFKIDSAELLKFIRDYHFETLEGYVRPAFWGNSLLKKAKPNINDSKLKYNMGTRGKMYWMYIVDEQSHYLWAQISYPDWHGD